MVRVDYRRVAMVRGGPVRTLFATSVAPLDQLRSKSVGSSAMAPWRKQSNEEVDYQTLGVWVFFLGGDFDESNACRFSYL